MPIGNEYPANPGGSATSTGVSGAGAMTSTAAGAAGLPAQGNAGGAASDDAVPRSTFDDLKRRTDSEKAKRKDLEKQLTEMGQQLAQFSSERKKHQEEQGQFKDLYESERGKVEKLMARVAELEPHLALNEARLEKRIAKLTEDQRERVESMGLSPLQKLQMVELLAGEQPTTPTPNPVPPGSPPSSGVGQIDLSRMTAEQRAQAYKHMDKKERRSMMAEYMRRMGQGR